MPRLLGFLRKSPKKVDVTSRYGEENLAPVAGVSTFAREQVDQVLKQRRAKSHWYGEIEGEMQAAPDNPVDARAIDVVVDGVRFGCLPSYLSFNMKLTDGEFIKCTVQVFVKEANGRRMVLAWVWFGAGRPQWEWSKKKFPPMTTGERSAHSQNQASTWVKSGLSSGGTRAAEIKRGMVDGVHYLELVEPIKQLKRENRLEEALQLCYQAIEGAERDRQGREPAPYYTMQAAIVHRKLGERQNEIDVLKRWVRHCPADRLMGSEVNERLKKLTRKN